MCVCARFCVYVCVNFLSTWEQRVSPSFRLQQGTRKNERVLVNEDPPPQPRVNVRAQRGQLEDTLMFIFISISFHAVPFPVSGTARA